MGYKQNDPSTYKLIKEMREQNIGNVTHEMQGDYEVRRLKEQVWSLQRQVDKMHGVMITFGIIFGVNALFTIIWWIKYIVTIGALKNIFS